MVIVAWKCIRYLGINVMKNTYSFLYWKLQGIVERTKRPKLMYQDDILMD